MKQMAFLNYTFLFDPSSTFSQAYQFEDALANFFGEYGLEATVIKTIGNPQGNKMIHIKEKDLPQLPKEKPSKGNAGKQIRQLGKM
jgi:hypothetical protein